jgi:hypothetical protein
MWLTFIATMRYDFGFLFVRALGNPYFPGHEAALA